MYFNANRILHHSLILSGGIIALFEFRGDMRIKVVAPITGFSFAVMAAEILFSTFSTTGKFSKNHLTIQNRIEFQNEDG